MAVWAASHSSIPSSVALAPSFLLGVQAKGQDESPKPPMPITLASLVESMKVGFKFFSGGNLPESRDTFVQILQSIPLLRPTKAEVEMTRSCGVCLTHLFLDARS